MTVIKKNTEVLEEKQIKQLEVCEKGIADSEFGSGKYLKQIKEEGLYKAHDTFETYCKKQWGFSRVHVGRLIAAHECLENLKKNQIGSVCIPTTESQARVIAGFKAEDQVRVAKAVKDSLGSARPAAKDFKAAAVKLDLVKTKPKTDKKTVGATVPTVPKPLLKLGQERIELVTETKKDIAALWEALDYAQDHVNNGSIKGEVAEAITEALAIVNYFVQQLSPPETDEAETPAIEKGGKVETK